MITNLYQIANSPETAAGFYGSRLFFGRLTKEQIILLCNKVLEQFGRDYELYEVFYERELRTPFSPPEVDVPLKGMHYSKTIDNLRKTLEQAEEDKLTPFSETQIMFLPTVIKYELEFALLFNDGNPLEQTVEAMEHFQELSIKPIGYDYI